MIMRSTVAPDVELDLFLLDMWGRLEDTGGPSRRDSELPYPPGSTGARPCLPREEAMVRSALGSGVVTENELTDLVFFRRYPRRNGRRISLDEPRCPELSKEWLTIRDNCVQPILRGVPPPIQPAPPLIPPRPPSPPSSGPPPPPSPPVSSPPLRVCCLLQLNQLADVASLGAHHTVGGVVYTGRAGFVDVAHVRHTADVTAWVYQQIHATGGASGAKIVTHEGNARLTRPVPAADWLEMARSIAYDDAMGHEIYWYWWFATPGMHNSGFSPEDLCSNYLGTVAAKQALLAGGKFAVAADGALRALLSNLNAQSLVETRKAFYSIALRWVDINLGPDNDKYLRRRNFTRIPWKAGHRSDASTPRFLYERFRVTTGYTFTHNVPWAPDWTFTRAQFPAKIAAIKANAKLLYGPRFDKPR